MAFHLSAVQRTLAIALIAHAEGLTIEQLRQLAAKHGEQEHLNRRLRSLRDHFHVPGKRENSRFVYKWAGRKKLSERAGDGISERLRAQVFALAGSRCQMCGKTVQNDRVELQVDHKIPRSWGGQSVLENLWATCLPCNRGKKNYFSSMDIDVMREVMNDLSVHWRIVKLLHLKHREWVPSDILNFVINYRDYQEDWQKRLRELRYMKLDVPAPKKMKQGRRMVTFYRLMNWVELPKDLTGTIRRYERERAKRNRRTDDI